MQLQAGKPLWNLLPRDLWLCILLKFLGAAEATEALLLPVPPCKRGLRLTSLLWRGATHPGRVGLWAWARARGRASSCARTLLTGRRKIIHACRGCGGSASSTEARRRAAKRFQAVYGQGETFYVCRRCRDIGSRYKACELLTLTQARARFAITRGYLDRLRQSGGLGEARLRVSRYECAIVVHSATLESLVAAGRSRPITYFY